MHFFYRVDGLPAPFACYRMVSVRRNVVDSVLTIFETFGCWLFFAEFALANFLAASEAVFFSLRAVNDSVRAAARASGLCLFLMSSREAPTIALWTLTVFRDLFLAVSSEIPFLCIRRKRTVHPIFRGFFLWRKRDSDFPLKNRKIRLSTRT